MPKADSAPPVGIADKCLPVNSDYVTEELKLTAKNELFEDEDPRTESLKSLRSLLSNVTDLHCQDDDLFLLAFLRARKFDVNRAFDLIKNFYTCLGKRGRFYYCNDFEHFKSIMSENSSYISSHRDSEGAAIIHFHFNFWDPRNISAEEHLAAGTLNVMQALLSPSTQIAGFHIIADVKDFSYRHLLQLTPSVLLFFVEIIQNNFPMRVRGIHVVNGNFFFAYVLPIVRGFLSKKLNKRLHIHDSDLKSLHKFFHPKILPAELGGELPGYDTSEWKKSMEGSVDYINHMLSFGYEKYLRKYGKSEMENGQ